ncbi:hypothetical protein C7974DRAFT_466726 [Boeremia exigua]|uniref:uncharacterized protein n=1 Tax=Boeremia exigua TaxID=749465 RepID=UPI001E8CF6C8|nr:uncharacterized protein C7974DRAFT_466726 [Boeremia exigua]KAH6613045.1 hypothetical protein C7974DRAFT_466726 [Boeremia exigua]
MRLSIAVAAVATLTPFVNAHGGLGLPQIHGLVDSLDRRVDALVANFRTGAFGTDSHVDPVLEARASAKECGEGIGSCPKDRGCCSTAGYCGSNSTYCYSPGCQYNYGPGCPEHQKPEGQSTESIPRAKIGSVPYGGNGIYGGFWACKDPGHVALTYDDGPMKDTTATILDLFKKYDAKATFFVTGNNIGKGRIDKTQEFIDLIKRMDTEGHQIASHTWTHLDLSKIDADTRKDQIINVEGALNNIIGKIPTYVRPPYSSCTADSGCQQFMQDMGYHIIYFKLDTDDYQQNPKGTFQNSLDWFKGNMTAPGMSPEKNSTISIAHDIIGATANELTELMLKTITELGYKGVTVGECLGDPKDNWYRQFGDSADRVGASSSSTSASSNSGLPSSQTASSSSTSGTSSASSPSGSTSSSPSGSSTAPPVTPPEQTASAATSFTQISCLAILVFTVALSILVL